MYLAFNSHAAKGPAEAAVGGADGNAATGTLVEQLGLALVERHA